MAANKVGSVSVPEWTVREQLVLASAVQRSGDQNWVSVSRAIKPLVEDIRPTDYFSQKNCALQYASMLDKVATPNKRKKRASEEGTETREQQIVRELTERRINELSKSLADIKKEYLSLSKEVELLEAGGEQEAKINELWEKLNSEGATASKQSAEDSSNASSTVSKHADSAASQPAGVAAKEADPQIKQSNERTPSTPVKKEPNASSFPTRDKITVKKDVHSPTDTESPLPRLPSISDDKVLSPMQTPQPTPLSTNLHIIVQQRNDAVDNLLADSSSKGVDLKASRTAPSTVSAPKLGSPVVSNKPFLSSSAPRVSAVPLVATSQPSTLSLPPSLPRTQAALGMTILSPTKAVPQAQPLSAQASTLPKSVPIMAYLSKAQNVTQPSRGNLLQSLVSASSPSLSSVTSLPAAAAVALSMPQAPAKTVLSPQVAMSAAPVLASPLPLTQVRMATSTKVGSVVSATVQAVKVPRPAAGQPVGLTPSPLGAAQSGSVSVAAGTSPLTIQKIAPAQFESKLVASVQKKNTPSIHLAKTEVEPKKAQVEITKDIKTLLKLPPSDAKALVEGNEPKTLQKDAGSPAPKQTMSSTKQGSESPNKKKTTPVKGEPELMDTPSSTPLSSPTSTVGSATPIPSIVTETLDGDTEDDTPIKFRKSRSILKRSLLTRSRKRKADDDAPSVESTDTEEDGMSSQATSAVPSPAPSQCSEMDADTLRAHKHWKKGIMIVWRFAAQHKYANFFLHPVREEDAPGYKDVILSPTDLSTIKRKVESGHIRNDVEFQREMLLMFQNAFMYNSSDHEVYKIAQDMKRDVMESLQTYLHVAAQAQIQLVEDPVPTKTLRGRRGEQSHDDNVFSPATKKRRTRNDD